MPAVSDTSPLNYLLLIGMVDVLPELYSTVMIARETYRELLAPDTPSAVREWALHPPSWISITDEEISTHIRWPESLQAADRAAIQLALRSRSPFLIMDERAGTNFARTLGIDTTGTLGALDAAARRGFISLEEAVAKLRLTTCRCSRKILEDLLVNRA